MLWNRAQWLFRDIFKGNWHSAQDFCFKKAASLLCFWRRPWAYHAGCLPCCFVWVSSKDVDRSGHVGRSDGGNYGVCQTLSQLKKGVNGHKPQLPGAERVQGRAECGPRMRSTTMSLLMTVNLSESGCFSRCSPPLAALPMALAAGLPARSTLNTRRTRSTKSLV